MGKVNLTSKKVKAKDIKETTTKYFNLNCLNEFIDQSKIDILNHNAEDIYFIGAKESGKTRPAVMKLIAHLETDFFASGLALKKYKSNAASRLHQIIDNVAREVKSKGFTVPDYEKGQNETYRMSQKTRGNNQTIEYASYEDYNSIAGIEAKNLGYFPVVLFEEPVEMGDTDTPNENEWNDKISALKSSVSRSNQRHMAVKGRVVPSTQYIYTMNPWDDHPIIVYAEKHYPIHEFEAWVKEDILNNNIKAIYVKEDDKLIVRNTIFNNPIVRTIEQTMLDLEITNLDDFYIKKDNIDWEADIYTSLGILPAIFELHIKKHKGSVLQRCYKAIETNKTYELASLLGFKYEGSDNVDWTYDLSNIKKVDSQKILENSTITSPLYIGVDIDHRKNRGIVITPTFATTQDILFDKKQNVVVMKQRFIKSSGAETLEEKNFLIEEIIRNIKEIVDNYYVSSKYRRFNENIIAIDDNNRQYIHILKQRLPDYIFTLAKKQTPWNILDRQSWVQTSINMGCLMIDEENVMLLEQMKKSKIKEGSIQRDESGKNEKMYDYINSMEYSLWYVRSVLFSGLPMGDESDYYERGLNV